MMRWIIDGVIMIQVRCGCCTKYFVEELGGSAFCTDCINGAHQPCYMLEIMGIKA